MNEYLGHIVHKDRMRTFYEEADRSRLLASERGAHHMAAA